MPITTKGPLPYKGGGGRILECLRQISGLNRHYALERSRIFSVAVNWTLFQKKKKNPWKGFLYPFQSQFAGLFLF